MHSHETHIQNLSVIVQLIVVIPFFISLISYIVAVKLSNQHKKQWPYIRTLCGILGHVCAILTLMGPLAELAHVNFSAHMVGHLLLGMLAPLLIALSAPITLFLRTIPVKKARFISRILRNSYFKFVSNPIIATILNVGGLWLLYTTPLFSMMHESSILYILIHMHIFLAGYLFTSAFIYIDPTPHQLSYVFRSIVLLIALAAHSILSKHIYAYPPNHVATEQAEQGAMIMYYGGDLIEIALVYILFYQWFKKTRNPVFAKPIIS
ncbi:cytochrome c oxidase assembly protein [Lysinibacillus sphaericus]|uniref:cytochrome c oxidase assembly protein n=1 Tax=Lysinibacillus sphaericus TaxID=1421 RepID=UPI00055B095A|nr:cytochrome c oxidase assembly protein [Lysinibacillus sphaericus]